MQLWKRVFSRRIPCPHCDSRSSALLYITPNVHMAGFRDIFCERVVQCRDCGFAFTNPRLSAPDLEKFYSRFYRLEGLEVPRTVEEFLGEKHRGIWFSKERDFALVQARKSGGDLLDVGCASGSLLWLARKAGFSVSGVEVGRQSAAFVKSVLGIDVFCGQLEDAPFREAQFDVVTMFHALEHVPNPRAVLRTIRRLLNDEGVFIAVVPNFGSWGAKSEGARWKWLQPQNHYSHFTAESLARMADAEGFDSQITSEEGRYGEEDIRARYHGDEISRIYEERQGSELILIARKRPLQPAVGFSNDADAGLAPKSTPVHEAAPVILEKSINFSVLIDTYNHERFIAQAIESVLAQDFPRGDMEILVVDDGSTDRTPEIVRQYEPQLRLIRKPNGGQASAFNAGISEARGEIVAFLDGDDWWAPEKLSRVAAAFAADPALGIVGHGITMVHRDGSQLSETLREGFQFQANHPEGAKLFRLRKSLMGTSRMAIRSEVLRRIGPVPEAIRVQADEYFFTLAAVIAPARILPEPLTFYRFHDENGFQISDMTPARLSNLNSSMRALTNTLSDALNRLPMDSAARRAILEILFAEAARTRLYVDGGWPWETAATEWTFRSVHGQFSSPLSALRNALSLAPALFLPPRAFYNMRSRVGNALPFRILKEHTAASDSRRHVENEWRSGAPATRPTAAGKH